jgi:hypothetical protein
MIDAAQPLFALAPTSDFVTYTFINLTFCCLIDVIHTIAIGLFKGRGNEQTTSGLLSWRSGSKRRGRYTTSARTSEHSSPTCIISFALLYCSLYTAMLLHIHTWSLK